MIYISTDYSRVTTVDARTGVRKWLWEPEYEAGLEAELCCAARARAAGL